MEPIDYLRTLKNRWKVVAALVVIAVVAVYLVSPKEARRTHRAEHVLLLESSSGEEDQVATIANVEVAALRVVEGEVPVRAARILGHDGESDELAGVAARLAANVEATGNRDLKTVTVTATDPDPRRAVEVANAFALALVEFVEDAEESRQERELGKPSARMAEIEKRLSEIDFLLVGAPPQTSGELRAEETQLRQELVRREAEVAAATGAVRYVTLAEATTAKADAVFFSTREQRMLLAALVAAILGLGVAVLLDRNDSRLRTKEQVEQAFGLPVLAEVPALGYRGRSKAAVVSFQHEPRVAEAYRSLRTALLLFPGAGSTSDGGAVAGIPARTGTNGSEQRAVRRTNRVTRQRPSRLRGRDRRSDGSGPFDATDGLRQLVVVTSPEPGEGKSTTATNLAMAYAEAGHTVLILCWDLWRPISPAVLGAVNGTGITDHLAGDGSPLKERVQATAIPRVNVVTTGIRRLGYSGSIAAARGLLDEARDLANVVIVDTAPILSVSMTRELATLADAVVVVCRAGRTTTDAGSRCAELLQRVGAPALGVVMVGVPTGAFADYYGPARRTMYGRLGDAPTTGADEPSVGGEGSANVSASDRSGTAADGAGEHGSGEQGRGVHEMPTEAL